MEVIAHRGASGYVLENSRQALELAWRLGADRVEIDVRATRDGRPLVLHDATLNRTTTGQGQVAELTWEELSEVRLKNGEPLLSLEEALDLLQGKVQVYLDVKDPRAVPGVARQVRELDGVIVGSTEPGTLSQVKARVPKAATSLLVRGLDDPVGKAVRAGAGYVHLCWDSLSDPVAQVNATLVRQAQEAGVGVILWHEEQASVLKRIGRLSGVHGVCTDLPDLARRLLGMPPGPTSTLVLQR
ncbi:MAG: Putative glycerophosphoryl diester phosphodiesterase [Acetothermia bacterium 64_32]|nr:MAG: Putative glycerophosphoryl diester phosphodiesterase [Acetothermia bacterium 64_32]MBC7099305.1 hypothetical protein [Candidatus Bipolaricaulota bacterium]HAF70326.1 hypothetical protein [Candidatus Acetothermia bacterium]